MCGGVFVLGDSREVALAEFPDRLAGRLLDPVILWSFVLAAVVVAAMDPFVWTYCGWCFDELGGLAEPLWREGTERVNVAVSIAVAGIIVLYEMTTIGLSGQTWGKRRRRMRMVTRRDGATPTAPRAFVRAFVPVAAGAGGLIGATQADPRAPALAGLALWLVVYASAMWGRNGRGWHDIAAGTVVINDHAYGRSGNATLNGGNGVDYLHGGTDTDTCTRAQTTAACENDSQRP